MNRTSHESIKRPRVAVFSHEIPSTTFIENLIKGLTEEGFDIYLFGFKKKDFHYQNEQIKAYIFPESALGKIYETLLQSVRMWLKNPRLWFKLYKRVFRHRSLKEGFAVFVNRLIILNQPIDVFHFQWAGDVEVYEEIIELIDSKIIVSFRGAHVNYAPIFRESLKKSYLKYFPKIDKFHAVSKALALEGAKYGADLNKVQVIYTSLNPEILNVVQTNRSKTSSPETLKVISVGRFHWKKGYNYALDAMLRLKDAHIPFHYTIIAAGKIDEEFLFQIIQNGLQDHIKIINGLPQKELAAFIQEQDVFLLPSVEEGIANVAIEAMALGTLVLTTDCGGMTEAIEDGKDGFVVPVRRADLIAEKLIHIYKMSVSELSPIREAAKVRVERQFSRDRMVREFKELYLEMLLTK